MYVFRVDNPLFEMVTVFIRQHTHNKDYKLPAFGVSFCKSDLCLYLLYPRDYCILRLPCTLSALCRIYKGEGDDDISKRIERVFKISYMLYFLKVYKL